MLTRYIEKNTKAPRSVDILKLEELFYNAYMTAWIVGYWNGENRINESIEAASSPRFKPKAAIKFILNKLALPPELLNAIQLKIATYSSKLAILTGFDGFRRVKELFARHMEKGQSKRELLEEIGTDGILKTTGFLKSDPYYIEVVYRTNLVNAYNAGNWDNMQKNKKFIAYAQYISVIDANTTDLCRNLNGTIRPLNDPLWDDYAPINHYQCRSELVAISKIMADVMDIKKTPIPPGDKLKFEKGNESFKGNSAKDFGGLSRDQKKRAREMGVERRIKERARGIRKDPL